MKLLLDQGLPRYAAELLRAAGVDAVHVKEVGLLGAEDPPILERGRVEGRTIVTLDADFHTLLARSGASEPSVIRIRIEGLKSQPAARLIRDVLTQVEGEVAGGHNVAVSVTETSVRYRRLPLP